MCSSAWSFTRTAAYPPAVSHWISHSTSLAYPPPATQAESIPIKKEAEPCDAVGWHGLRRGVWQDAARQLSPGFRNNCCGRTAESTGREPRSDCVERFFWRSLVYFQAAQNHTLSRANDDWTIVLCDLDPTHAHHLPLASQYIQGNYRIAKTTRCSAPPTACQCKRSQHTDRSK